MTTYIPKHEEISGASLFGSSGDTGRTYTLSNDNAIRAQLQIVVAENIYSNISFDSDNGIITFNGAIFDDQEIVIDYFVTDDVTPTVTGTNYCTTLQITQASGIGVEVFNENLGTGDNSTTSYDLKNGNVIDGSYTVKYAPSGSNTFNTMIEDTHYSINLDGGTIVLSPAGVSLLGTDVLYIDYVYSQRHSNSLLESYLPQITAEVEKLTGNYWGPEKTSVQYFDGYDSGYPQTDKPYGYQIEDYPEFELKYRGVQSITKVEILDKEGNVDDTLDSTQYRVVTDDDYMDSRILINRRIPNGKANIKVTFTHGYTTPPELVQQLASYVGGMMALVNISGGSYKDVSTYSLGRKSFSIGMVYVNIESSVKQLSGRIESLTNILGGNFDCV